MGSCDGKVALVTGASRGIGAAAALRLAAEGADVAVTARTLDHHDHLAGSLNETVRADRGRRRTWARVVADLADGDDRARIVPEVEAALGTVDILVNNAAAAFYLPTPEITLKRRRIMYELNVHAPIDLAQGVIPGMRDQGPRVDRERLERRRRSTRAGRRSRRARRSARSRPRTDRRRPRSSVTPPGSRSELYGEHIAVNSVAPVAAVRTPGCRRARGRPDGREPRARRADGGDGRGHRGPLHLRPRHPHRPRHPLRPPPRGARHRAPRTSTAPPMRSRCVPDPPFPTRRWDASSFWVRGRTRGATGGWP